MSSISIEPFKNLYQKVSTLKEMQSLSEEERPKYHFDNLGCMLALNAVDSVCDDVDCDDCVFKPENEQEAIEIMDQVAGRVEVIRLIDPD